MAMVVGTRRRLRAGHVRLARDDRVEAARDKARDGGGTTSARDRRTPPSHGRLHRSGRRRSAACPGRNTTRKAGRRAGCRVGTGDPDRSARDANAAKADCRRAQRSHRSHGGAEQRVALTRGTGTGRRHRHRTAHHRANRASAWRRRSTPVTKHVETLALVFAFSLASTALVRTQEKPATPPPPKPPV